MTAFVNPAHGDDATARFNDRNRPWRSHKPALEALEAARATQAAEPGGIREEFRMVETHKPLRHSDAAEGGASEGSADTPVRA